MTATHLKPTQNSLDKNKDAFTKIAPEKTCSLCPRLYEFRQSNIQKYPEKHNGPVPSFGPLDAKLLIVGLAPGLKGANFTGRPFTGDYAGELLYPTLLKFKLAQGQFEACITDSLELLNCRITNAVRCVPPENKPIGSEMKTCLSFLEKEIKAMKNLRTILSLGLISHNAVLKALGRAQTHFKFAHEAVHELGHITLIDSYHCSRYNTNTGRLTPEMFENAVQKAIKIMDTKPAI